MVSGQDESIPVISSDLWDGGPGLGKDTFMQSIP
jgi:hypothetical protein